MNPEIKAEWIKRLRSGDYRQGKGKLAVKQVDGVMSYCCLGVLCEMAVEAGVVTSGVSSDVTGYGEFPDEDHLPEAVQEWAGLGPGGDTVSILVPDELQCPDVPQGEEDCGSPTCPICHRDSGLDLVTLNDEVESTFPEIADIIEKWL